MRIEIRNLQPSHRHALLSVLDEHIDVSLVGVGEKVESDPMTVVPIVLVRPDAEVVSGCASSPEDLMGKREEGQSERKTRGRATRQT